MGRSTREYSTVAKPPEPGFYLLCVKPPFERRLSQGRSLPDRTPTREPPLSLAAECVSPKKACVHKKYYLNAQLPNTQDWKPDSVTADEDWKQ